MIYLFCSIILGIILGIIAYALVEKSYINSSLSRGEVPHVVGERGFFLPLGMANVFLTAGAIFGYVVGVRWWQIVYVEKRHWRMRKNNLKHSHKIKK